MENPSSSDVGTDRRDSTARPDRVPPSTDRERKQGNGPGTGESKEGARGQPDERGTERERNDRERMERERQENEGRSEPSRTSAASGQRAGLGEEVDEEDGNLADSKDGADREVPAEDPSGKDAGNKESFPGAETGAEPQGR